MEALHQEGDASMHVPLISGSSEPVHDRLSQPPSYEESSVPRQLRCSRLLDRDAAFHQSRGHWGVRRLAEGTRLRRPSQISRLTGPARGVRGVLSMFWGDWFHTLAYRPTLQLMAIIFTSYASLVFLFAYIYLGVSILGAKITVTPNGTTKDSFCGMDITNHMEALYFSLSTMTTIGYGVSDYYFGDCWTPLLLVLLQSCCSITFQSIAIGLLFQRISRGQKRSRTIIFSDKAVVRRVKGIPYIMLRIGELRRQQLINVSVRCYCVKHERYVRGPGEVETYPFLTRHVKLLYPDENIGSHFLMSIPQVIVHCIDSTSPLIPKSTWYDKDARAHEKTDLELYHKDRDIEIIVQIEGIDELTGQALQARHSYRWNDIAWDYTFAPCVEPWNGEAGGSAAGNGSEDRQHERREGDPICSIDFARFHDITPAHDTDECPYVPS